MANESIALRAKAKNLGIEGYKGMSQDELRTAIKSASAKAAPKSAGSNGGGRKTAPAKTAGKKTAPAKSAPKKSAPKVTKPAAKKSPAKSPAAKRTAKSAPAKSASAGNAKRPTSGGAAGRIAIDNSNIDWTAESNVGQSGGNRQVIMKALRSKKGVVQKVYDLLADKAQSMYGKTQDGKRRSKGEAQTLLRWHISRVKFDFVKDTGQHNGVVRSNGGGGKSTPKSSGKSAPARKPAARKPAAKKAPARKATGKKTAPKKSSKR